MDVVPRHPQRLLAADAEPLTREDALPLELERFAAKVGERWEGSLHLGGTIVDWSHLGSGGVAATLR
jgi:hypothetical protein